MKHGTCSGGSGEIGEAGEVGESVKLDLVNPRIRIVDPSDMALMC